MNTCRIHKLIFIFLTLLFSLTSSVFPSDLILSGPLSISSDTTFDSVIIQAGGFLIANAQVTVLGDMRIDSGGVVTHSSGFVDGLNLDVSDTLEVKLGGMIDVFARGLRGGNLGSTLEFGETFDENDSIVAGAGGHVLAGFIYAAGASYGGLGPPSGQGDFSNLPYGVLENPRHLGSGGGGHNQSGRGSHGGGRVTITAGWLIVDGIIKADGGGVTTYYGAGSGGAILINAGTVSGSGTITARGDKGNGSVDPNGTSGGGGRIAIYYDTMSFPSGNISAVSLQALNSGRTGSAGTVYLKDNAQINGEVIIDNGGSGSIVATPIMTDLISILNLLISGNANVDVTQEFQVAGELLVEPGSRIGND